MIAAIKRLRGGFALTSLLGCLLLSLWIAWPQAPLTQTELLLVGDWLNVDPLIDTEIGPSRPRLSLSADRRYSLRSRGEWQEGRWTASSQIVRLTPSVGAFDYFELSKQQGWLAKLPHWELEVHSESPPRLSGFGAGIWERAELNPLLGH